MNKRCVRACNSTQDAWSVWFFLAQSSLVKLLLIAGCGLGQRVGVRDASRLELFRECDEPWPGGCNGVKC